MRNNNRGRNRRGKRLISSKTWFAIHAWSGFKLGILLFIVFASGTLATVSHELDWLTQADMRIEARDSGYDFAAMLDRLERTFPAARVDIIQRPEAAGFAALARIRDPELGIRRVMLDPYTGEVLGHAHWYSSFQRFLRDFHRYLLLPNFLGIYVVGATAFLTMASLISSFWIYPNWWRGFFRFRPGRSGAGGFWKELHKLFGVWSMAFVLIMGITGIWYVLEFTLALAGADDALQFERPGLAPERVEEIAPGTARMSPEGIISIARSELPGIRIGSVIPPAGPESSFYITGQTGEVLVRDRASHVFIDPYNGHVLARQHASEIGPVRRWVDTADPLHFGDFAGLWSKVPYLLFGTGMSMLAATGVWLRWKRIRVMLTRDAAKVARGQRARMGRWKWATAIALFGSVGFGSWQIGRYNAPDAQWDFLGKTVLEASGHRLESRVFRQDGTLYAAFPPQVHFDPDRHRISVPDCNLPPSILKSHVHHRVVGINPDQSDLADCIRDVSTAEGTETSSDGALYVPGNR